MSLASISEVCVYPICFVLNPVISEVCGHPTCFVFNPVMHKLQGTKFDSSPHLFPRKACYDSHPLTKVVCRCWPSLSWQMLTRARRSQMVRTSTWSRWTTVLAPSRPSWTPASSAPPPAPKSSLPSRSPPLLQSHSLHPEDRVANQITCRWPDDSQCYWV